MAITPINVGTSANDGTGDPHRTAFQKTNNNINEVTTNGGAIINVTDPVDSTTKELNTALQNIFDSGGGATPDLQAVTDVNLNVDGYAETTNGIKTSKLIAENFKVDSALEYFDFAGATPNFHYSPSAGLNIQDDAQENGVVLFQSGLFQILKNGFPTDLEPTATTSRLLYLPDKDGTLATTDDITGIGYTVVNANLTAVNDTNYTVVANATFTDPSPTEGKGYVVYVRNGTATIGGTGYAVGSLVFRVFHSGAWSTREYKSNLTLDATPTNGSTNGVESNGVFDALALKQDKSTSETFIYSKSNQILGSHTGNTAETVLFSVDINANEYEAGDILTFFNGWDKLSTNGTALVRVRAGINGNTSDALISTYAPMVNTTLMQSGERRNMQFITGNILRGIRNITSVSTDIGAGISSITSTSLNPTNAWKLTITVQLADAADTLSLTCFRIGKIKSF